MEIQIKKAVVSGNSSAVILPRAWLNKEVRVELLRKDNETILSDSLEIINKYLSLKEVIGIYLVGSYARQEEDDTSDIDILVITNNIDKKIIKEGIYNLLIISSELLNYKLKRDLLPIGQMLRESTPLLNASYIDSIEIKAARENSNIYLDTTQEKIDLIKKVIELSKKRNKEKVSDFVAYTLVLRIRTLYIIESIINKKPYSKIEFVNKLNKIYKGVAYNRYISIKNNRKTEDIMSLDEAEFLNEYLQKELIKVKKKLTN